jgi:hypothetical protein
VETPQEEILIRDDFGVPRSSPCMPDLGREGSSSGAVAGRIEGPSSSKPPVECRPKWEDLKNIGMFL